MDEEMTDMTQYLGDAVGALKRAVLESRAKKLLADRAKDVRQERIPPAPRGGRLPLSWAQQRLWFLQQLDQAAGSAYLVPASLRLSGTLDKAALKASLDRIVARHENLRTRFVSDADGPHQVIDAPEVGFELSEHDLRALDGTRQETALQRLVEDETSRPFDLERDRLIRGMLLSLSDTEHVLCVTQHHIISDGWSRGVFVNEVFALYDAFSRAQPDPLPPLALQYADYAVWQRAWLQGETLQKQVDFWRAHLTGAPALLELPTDRVRPQTQSYAGAAVELRLPLALSEGLRALSQRHAVTLFMTLLAGWSILMARLSGQDDVVTGTPVANRQRSEIENLMGFFVNTLALRVDLGADPSVSELLSRVKASTLGAYSHQDLPFEQVVEALKVPRSMAHNPLFQMMLTLSNATAATDLSLPGLSLRSIEDTSHSAQFDLNLSLHDGGGEIVGRLEYAVDLFEQATVGRFVEYFETILAAMVADAQQVVSRIPLLGDAERAALAGFNATAVDYPSDLLVHQLFERRAASQPDALAVEYERTSLSYAELNRQANRLAHHLRSLGVGPDARVAICAERSLEMVVGLLAILKAGGGYVPLDPSYPAERLAYMLDDCAPMVVLTQNALRWRFADVAAPVVLLDHALPAGLSEADPQADGLTPQHLAYVIYTSGSTGQPKGVMNAHAGVVNRLLWAQDTYRLDGQDRVLQKTPFGFDVSVWEFFLPLLAGARLVMARPLGHQDPAYLARVAAEAGITTMHFVPSMLQIFLRNADLESCAALRRVLCSGEALPYALQQQFHACLPQVELHNLYGPTEAAVDVTAWQCRPGAYDGIVPIGRPIANTQIHVLDRHLQPVPMGVTGEIHIGGVQVARGYLHKEALTAERFIADPFSAAPDARLYKTGDLGRWLADGSVEYLGRNDFQVKLRGLRIELGEIEARLRECAGVRDAVVVMREDRPGDQRLVAYLLAHGKDAPAVRALRAQLLTSLAEYMVPSGFITLAEWPLTPNGKLDRKALPARDMLSPAGRDYVAPEGRVEQTLAAIWADLLMVERVGRDDHFFELGGNSLMAVSMIERLREQGIAADVRSVFTTPTLQGMAERMGAANPGVSVPPNLIPVDCTAITPDLLPLVSLSQDDIDRIVDTVPGGAANVQDIYPLAPLQAGILFHHLLNPDDDIYLQRRLLSFDSRARMEEFLGALQQVIDRHDILRTAVLWQDLPQAVQVVHRDAPVVVEPLACAPGRDAWQHLLNSTKRDQVRFDLRRAPMMTGSCVEDTVTGQWHLALLHHHIVCDHRSLQLVIGEIRALLTGAQDTLAPALPYRNFVAATLTADPAEHEAYFREQLGDIEEPTAPFGLFDLHGGSAGLEGMDFALSADLAAGIRAAARRHAVPPAVLFHLAWALFLARCCDRDDVVFGSVLSGRLQGAEGADRVMGMFITTLPLRMRVDGRGVGQAVKEAYAGMTALLEHEQCPLTLAQRCSAVDPTTPLFTTFLNYRHSRVSSEADLQLDGAWKGIQFESESQESSNFPISLAVDDLGKGFGMNVQAAGVAPGKVLGLVLTALESIVAALLGEPERPLTTLAVLPPAEYERVTEGFNDTAYAFPNDEALFQELFEEQVKRTPNAAAVVYGDESVTYGELNRRANRFAHYLISQGVRPEQCVALYLDRGIDMIVGLLATIKAGAAYVPIDVGMPLERVTYMIRDCGCVAVLTQEDLFDRVSACGLTPLALDAPPAVVQMYPERNPEARTLGVTPDSLLYVIYTSGATGQPKGVLVEHRSVINFWNALQIRALADFKAPVNVTLNASISFDASVQSLTRLLSGDCLWVVPQSLRADGAAMIDFIVSHRIQVVDCTPAQLELLLDAGIDQLQPGYRITMLVGGEAITPQAWMRLRQAPAIDGYNVYGPTETTVEVTVGEIGGDTLTPHIGFPIANTRVYILDRHMQPVPVGVAGELYIGGACVTRGYFKRPELNTERFLSDPFSPLAGARMYKSGDLAHWRENGCIEHLGRNDFQVKIRGYRIELGEIETALNECDGVRQAVVVARQDALGGKQLVAYLQLEDGADVETATLRATLARRLPDYMVPSVLTVLEALPLTQNAKVDRKALPGHDQVRGANRSTGPLKGELERCIAEIWQDCLGIEQIGRDDHFFELGGHSLIAVQVVADLTKALGREVELRRLFDHPVLHLLANSLMAENESAGPANLVKLRAQGTLAPVFFVHDGSGGLGYVQGLLPSMAPGFPVYGLMADGLAGGDTLPPRAIEDMAAQYVRQLREVQPRGPYRLAGYSSGGTIAYEMANQLLGRDESVEFLGLFDTLCEYGEAAAIPDPEAAELEELVGLLGRLPGVGPQEVAAWEAYGRTHGAALLLEQVQAEGMLPPGVTPDQLRRLLAVANIINEAVVGYVRPKLGVPVTLFRANERPAADGRADWTGCLAPHSEVIAVGGDHMSMMQLPHVEALGYTLSGLLAASPRTIHAEQDYNPLITLQSGRPEHRPLFCIPGAGASVTAFNGLVQSLDPALPVYGLQPRGFCTKLAPHADVESAARAYVRAVRAIDPAGPYRLLGHSFGGWVAYEMAMQLQAEGSQVELLVALDTQSPFGRTAQPRLPRTEMLMRLVNLFQMSASAPLNITLAELEQCGAEEQLRLLLSRLIEVKLMHARTSLNTLRGLVRVFEANLNTRYAPPAYTGRLHLVDVEEGRRGPDGKQSEQVMGWQDHLDDVVRWTAPGNHNTMLNGANVGVLGQWLQALLIPSGPASSEDSWAQLKAA
jgi:arthrofactin-type cyclic lipopeptide synthetase C